MALTKKMLQAMDLTEDKIDQIIEAHRSTINGLTDERDALKADVEKYKTEAERLASVEKDLIKAQGKLEDAEKTSEKLKALQNEFDEYKADVDAKATQASKEKAFRELLKEAGISEKRYDAIIKVSDMSAIEIDKDGKIKDAKSIVGNIKNEWADFIVIEGAKGASTPNPPSSGGMKSYSRDDIKHMSPDEINKNWDSIKDSLKQI